MASKNQPKSYTPKDGGALVSRADWPLTGFPNYTVKLDFRRDYDQEMRREGNDYFHPNLDAEIGNQPYPQRQPGFSGTKPIILLHQARRPNGQTAVIAGTDDTLYRFRAADEGDYIEDESGGFYVDEFYVEPDYIVEGDDPSYVVDDYITNEEGTWEVIGSGFDPNGARWEAVNINGWAIFNNAADLPQTFRVEHNEVRPNYEMREAGIALVGTITDYVGALICGDVAVIKEDQFAGLFSHEDSGSATLRQHGAPMSTPFTVRAEADTFIIVTPVAATPGGLTRTGAVARFVCAAPHKLTTNQVVKVSGASDAAYNGLFPVTVIDPLVFTYAIAGTPPSPDPGIPVMQRALFGTATFNYDALVGREFFALNGWRSRITQVVDPVKIQIEQSTTDWVGDYVFLIVNDATVPLTGTVAKNGTVTVAGTGTLFTDELYPGASIRIPGGVAGDEIGVVAAITSNTALTVTKAFVGTDAGQVAQRTSDYLLISDEDYFTPEMVGRFVFFDDGAARMITGFVDARRVETDSFVAVAEQEFKLENTTAYGRIDNASLYDRIQYRRAWSDIDEPLRWAASTPGTILQGSRLLELSYQRRSFELGDSIIVTGAGTAGGNLTAEIVYVHPNHTTVVLDRAAETTAIEEPVARSDAAGSIAGFDDLQDDGSPIVKMLDLRGTLVSYKETAIFLSNYTGDPLKPFTAIRRYQGSKTPFYRNTLINVDGRFHLYAGRVSFYLFDLVSQSPEEFDPLEACHDLFYSQVRLENNKLIFSFRNVLTKEIFFCFPSASPHHALCYDFIRTKLAPAGTVSTTAEWYTAGAWIKKPKGGPVVGITEDWVILGGPTGTVMRYGKADDPDEEFGGATAIYNRLGSGYESRLKGGLYGDRFHETTMTEWMAELATQDYPTITSYTFNLYGYRNSAEAPRLVMTTPMPLPATANLVPMLFREHYFQDEIVITGSNNPLRLAARTVCFSKTASRGVQKAGLT